MAKPLYTLEDESLFTGYEGYRQFTSKESWGEQQDYKWTCLIYPDCTTYANSRTAEDILSIVRNWGYQEWAYILHDRDVKADGTPKKPHYHVCIKTVPSKLSTVARTLGIPENYVQRVKSWRKMMIYLTHDETVDKAKYNVEEVICSDSQNYLKYFDSSSEEEDANKLLNYILESGCSSYVQLMSWACTNGFYATLRRNASMWSNVIREMQKYGGKEF